MKKTMLLISFYMTVITACSALSPVATPTPTADSEATAEALEAEEALSTQNAQGTADAINATAETEATLTQAAVTPTIAAIYAARTAQVDKARGFVESLYDADLVSTTEGRNLTIDGFVNNMAKINYFTWSYTNYAPSDFAFRSEIRWQSASEVANWFDSGCGLVFRENQNGENFYVVTLYLDGNVKFRSYNGGSWHTLQTKYYGRVDVPDGEAELILTVEGDHVQVFINSELMIDARDARHAEGDFGFTVSSGTNKDFGTRCSFTNTILWELDSGE